MTDVLKTHQISLAKSPSVKANRRSCANFKKGSCQRGDLCYCWHVPNVQNSKLQVDADSETGAYKHTAKPAVKNKELTSIAIHIPSNDERQMQLQNIQSDDKTQFPVRLHHLGNRYVLKRENETYSWSHPDWISKSAKSKRSNIRGKIYRMDFENGRNSKESSLVFTQDRVCSSRFVF